jgi:hypothetical protein
MRHNWTCLTALAIGTLAWGQTAQEEELKTAVMKAKIAAELAAVKGDIKGAMFGVSGPTVTGAPYSAEAVTESVQTLGDGNTIRKKTVVRVFRDGAGRTARQEADAKGNFQTVQIFDPVANVTHVLDSQSRTAVTRPLAMKKFAPVPDTEQQRMAEVEKKLAEAKYELALKQPEAKYTLTIKQPEARTETLPAQTMEGLRVEGTRNSSSIPAGTIGNDRPIETYSERWYSPELQVVVMTKRHDPRSGDVTYQLQRVQRAEPAPYLFQIPGDYKVETQKIGVPLKKPPFEMQ